MPDLELRRYETYLYKPKSGSDDAQIPLAGATLAVTRQGASVRTESELIYEQETAQVEVHDCGLIVVGDNLMRDFDDTVDLSVLSIASDRRSMMVQNVGGGAVQLAVGERLRPTTGHPSLYKDPRAKQSLATPTVDSLGYVWFFTPATTVDFVVSGGGLASPRMYTDKPVGWRREGETWRNVNDYASIQAAIDSLPAEGGTVYIPAGEYTLTQTLYTPCDRPCHIVGEGAQMDAGPSTVLRWTTNTGMVRMRGDHSSLRGVSLRMDASGDASSEDQGYGVFIGRRGITDAHPHPGTSTTATEHAKYGNAPLKGMLIEDVHIFSSPGWGVTIPGFGEDSQGNAEAGRVTTAAQQTLSFWVDVRRVRVTGSRKYGALFTGGGCTTLFFDNCAFLHVGDEGNFATRFYAYLRKTVGAIFRNTTFEGASPPEPSGENAPPFNPWVRLVGCQSTTFETCWFENDPHYSGSTSVNYEPQYFIHLAAVVDVPANQGVSVLRVHFARGGSNAGLLKLIYCDASGVVGVHVESPLVISNTPVISADEFIDALPIALNGSANTNTNAAFTIVGNGMIWDGTPHSLLVATMPRKSTMLGRDTVKLPVSTLTEIQPGGGPGGGMLRQDGSMAIVELGLGGSSPAAGALMTYWGGRDVGWRLSNACPVLTTSERDARTTWVNGEMIINSTTDKLELRYGGIWINIKSLP